MRVGLAVALSCLLLLFALARIYAFTAPGGPMACLLRAATGLPCPTCGGTRATFALVSGDLGLALRYNPLVTAAWLVFPVALPAAMLYRRGSRSARRTGGQRRWVLRGAVAMAIAAGLVNWAYVIANLRDVERENTRSILSAPASSLPEADRDLVR